MEQHATNTLAARKQEANNTLSPRPRQAFSPRTVSGVPTWAYPDTTTGTPDLSGSRSATRPPAG
ncbi:MAG: hypothetical protein WCK27_16525 [Verrucomicrobiota bacterium]